MFKTLSKYILLSSITLGTLISCGDGDTDYVYYRNPPVLQTSSKSYALKTLLRDAEVDIVWIVDNSGSMGSIQQNIIDNSTIFMEEFLDSNLLNWKIGLVSTDKNDTPYLGFHNYFGKGLYQSPSQYVQEFKSSVKSLGTTGDPYEYVFYNAERALAQFPTYTRENGHLIFIMVSDEKEQSEEKFGKAYNASNFVQKMKAGMKGRDGILRFYGALKLNDLKNCKKSSAAGDYAGSPYEEVIKKTGGFVISACGKNWGRKLSDIGKDIVTLVRTPKILLKEKPKIHTIKVYFDGKLLKSGRKEDGGQWYYDDYFNTINFYNVDDVSGDDDAEISIDFDIDDGIYRPE
jgi:hypothetical protein